MNCPPKKTTCQLESLLAPKTAMIPDEPGSQQPALGSHLTEDVSYFQILISEIIFLNEPGGIAAEEQPKPRISKTGDVYLSGIRALTKTSSGLD
jgi:hypothetical protein